MSEVVVKLFPTIWYRDNEAGFYLSEHLVRVPLKFGSNNNAEHVIPWLHRCWPFHVETGKKIRPQLVKKIDGKKVSLHKVYARLIYGDDFVVDAADGDLLHWTVENIGPRHKPGKIVPQGSQDHEAIQQMFLNVHEQSAPRRKTSFEWVTLDFAVISQEIARAIKKDRAETLRALEAHGVIAADKMTDAQTLAVIMQTDWERRLAATRTRGDADADRTEEHLEAEMPQDELVPETRPERYPDGVMHVEPAHPVATDDAANDPQADPEGWMPEPSVRSSYDYYSLTLEEFRAGLGLIAHPGTEAVLRRHGWKTPANNHHPEYIGKGKGSGNAV
jgi:hypothetical protein